MISKDDHLGKSAKSTWLHSTSCTNSKKNTASSAYGSRSSTTIKNLLFLGWRTSRKSHRHNAIYTLVYTPSYFIIKIYIYIQYTVLFAYNTIWWRIYQHIIQFRHIQSIPIAIIFVSDHGGSNRTSEAKKRQWTAPASLRRKGRGWRKGCNLWAVFEGRTYGSHGEILGI